MALGDKSLQVLRRFSSPGAKITLKQITVWRGLHEIYEAEVFALYARIDGHENSVRGRLQNAKAQRINIENSRPQRDHSPFPPYRGEGVIEKLHFPSNNQDPEQLKQKELNECDRVIEGTAAELELTEKRRKHVGIRRSAWGNRLQRNDRYLAELDRTNAKIEFEPELINIKLKRNDDVGGEIRRDDELIEKLHCDRREVEAAKIDIGHAKKLATASVIKLADEGRPVIGPMLSRQGEIYWKKQFVSGEATIVDALGLVAWLEKDKMIAALLLDIDEEYKENPLSFTNDERAKRLLEIDAEILKIERHAESLTAFAIENNLDLVPRANADPRAMLRLTDAAPVLFAEAA